MDDRFDFAGPQQSEHVPNILMVSRGAADQADLLAENIAHVNLGLRAAGIADNYYL